MNGGGLQFTIIVLSSPKERTQMLNDEEEQVGDEEEEEEEVICGLENLPDAVLLDQIFCFLSPQDLASVCCCSTRLRDVSKSDSLWFPITLEWEKNPQNTLPLNVHGVHQIPFECKTWHQLFCYKQSWRCVECKTYTSYIFKLMGSPVRLCERCEFKGQKYALATESEAKGRYLLTEKDLQDLPFKEVKLKKFSVYLFLRSSLEQTAAAKSTYSGDYGTEEEEGTEEEDEENADRHHGGTSVESDDNISSLTKQEKRALRKQNKRLVKREKRERRAYAKGDGGKNSRGGAHSDTEAQTNETTPKQKFKKVWKTKRDHISEGQGGYGEKDSVYYSSQLKSKSPSDWIKEREVIERELGVYGISALELA